MTVVNHQNTKEGISNFMYNDQLSTSAQQFITARMDYMFRPINWSSSGPIVKFPESSAHCSMETSQYNIIKTVFNPYVSERLIWKHLGSQNVRTALWKLHNII